MRKPLGVIPWLVLTLSVLGVVVSAYLTYEHFTAGTTLACPETGVVNCMKVTSSKYSELLGIPVAVLGLLFFVGMTALSLPALWRTPSPWPSRLRLAGVVTGVVFVLYLVWAELFRINAICLWCTVVHGLTLVLFALVVIRIALPPLED
ncbi:vitamin K epoxide reductase family protein [Kribbella sandramycini]|uniref:Putative membrane protein n=1 Tax=Kribbella sandramycini TaxID=60450 RepID=A0A7Y4NYP1_9ACTN|nr:vitamin K epoxide reductase family protein [Kribbella sandramycini]MBB6568056.1 putative membrane protein [Kribbella sandramycini]NOL39350.1 vitamin K epoxide reductase family protein [Kribbella sandramycini]